MLAEDEHSALPTAGVQCPMRSHRQAVGDIEAVSAEVTPALNSVCSDAFRNDGESACPAGAMEIKLAAVITSCSW